MDQHDELVTVWNQSLFGVQRSIRYHARRQAFFDFWNTLTNASSIILGAGTIVALIDQFKFADVLRVVFPATITILSTFNLVWGTNRLARLHNDLYRRYVALEQEMLATTELTAEAVQTFRAKRLAIEADEPPTKFAVDVLCHNELVRALGSNEYREVTLVQRAFAHFTSFSGAEFPSKGQKVAA